MEEIEEQGAIKQFDKNVYAKTFLWMFLGLLATGIISFYTYTSGLFLEILYADMFGVILIGELLVVLVFSLFFRKLPPIGAAILFFIYAVVNGVSLSVIFAVYEISSIAIVFVASAVLFGIFAIIGAKTKIDLSKWYVYLFGALALCIVVSIINLFLGYTILDIVISWIVLLLFFGITAYDMHMLKTYANLSGEQLEKAHIYGAMTLYLDFINIFLRVLRIFGKRR